MKNSKKTTNLNGSQLVLLPQSLSLYLLLLQPDGLLSLDPLPLLLLPPDLGLLLVIVSLLLLLL